MSYGYPPDPSLPPPSDPDPDFNPADWRTRSERETDEWRNKQEQR